MGLKVIGAGLGRTGTASLKMALERLGFGRCYHMGEVLSNLEAVPLWVAAGKGAPDWDRIFDGCASAVDYPSCNFWQQQLSRYPDAKVVLSTRDPESWFDSVNSTIMADDTNAWIRETPLREFFELCVWRDFEPHISDREFMVDYYRRREAEIKASVPAERLLVYNVKEGWEPLCTFLEVGVPDVPFPRVNSREETRKLLDAMIASERDETFQATMREESERLFRDER